jgi:membrane protease YdiL (CAAX protease family)
MPFWGPENTSVNMSSTDLPSNRDLMAMAVLAEGGLGILAVGVGWFLGMNPLELVTGDWWALAWGCLAALPMLAALALTEYLSFWPFRDINDVVDQLLRPLFAKTSVAKLAVISALAGIGEELMFRGLIQEGLARWIGEPMGVWIALGVASILFGLLHPMNLAYVLLAAVMGLCLGGLWIVTGNLLVPIVSHAVYDFLALLWLVKFQGPARSSDSA